MLHIAQTACKTCGEQDIRLLCFHHRDPSTKSFAISKGITHYASMARLKTEAEKCDVLCLHCHTILHSASEEDIERGLSRSPREERAVMVESVHDLDDLHGSVNELYSAWDDGAIDERTARRDGVEACVNFLGIERILESVATALNCDISSWDEHKKKSAATVILLSLSFEL